MRMYLVWYPARPIPFDFVFRLMETNGPREGLALHVTQRVAL